MCLCFGHLSVCLCLSSVCVCLCQSVWLEGKGDAIACLCARRQGRNRAREPGKTDDDRVWGRAWGSYDDRVWDSFAPGPGLVRRMNVQLCHVCECVCKCMCAEGGQGIEMGQSFTKHAELLPAQLETHAHAHTHNTTHTHTHTHTHTYTRIHTTHTYTYHAHTHT